MVQSSFNSRFHWVCPLGCQENHCKKLNKLKHKEKSHPALSSLCYFILLWLDKCPLHAVSLDIAQKRHFNDLKHRDALQCQFVCFFIVNRVKGGGSNPFIKKFVPLLVCSGGHNLQHKMCIKSHFWHEISTLRSS